MSYKFKPKSASDLKDVEVSNIESLGLVSLEPRILLDAAGFVTGAEVAMEAMAVEGAELGVQAIFESTEEATAAPVNGPWLAELTQTDTDDVPNDDVTDAPVNGPWLGD